ncbi:MAG: hypothetical protein GF418_09960 [Chitinivibrionales bacterium]|nr:hypothetical protein [Chitinivibrionales bacterium]MBD3395936.1 hypothetical protein [Chitinivibrionales bacterium]
MQNSRSLVLCLIALLCPAAAQEEALDQTLITRARAVLGSGLGSADSVSDSLIGLPDLPSRMRAAERFKKTDVEPEPILLDRAIDPAEYILGPGDHLHIYIWGRVEENHRLMVNSECRVVVPRIGVIDVRGKTLAEGRALLEEQVLAKYRGVRVQVTLSTIRRFRCYVLGEVERPGAYIATGVTRVSDAIRMAGGITDSGATRGIVVANEVLGSRTADMAKFFNSTVIEANPYLREGDRVFVPHRTQYVSVHGAVPYPYVYDYCDGDMAADLIEAAGGLGRGVDSSRIIITRFADNHDELERFVVSIADLESFELRRDDRLMVSGHADYRVHRNVTIEGEVRFPGVYPIREDQTRLSDAIQAAGGLTEDASFSTSRIIRDTLMDQKDPELVRLKVVEPQLLDPTEIAYIRSRSRQSESSVRIDVGMLRGAGFDEDDIILRNGDRVIIARKELTVLVSGAVVAPGHVPYNEGAGYRHYIREAGGYAERARKRWVRVRRKGTRVFRDPGDVGGIRPGDEILVAERTYRDPLLTARDYVAIVSSLATVVLTVFTIQSLVRE